MTVTGSLQEKNKKYYLVLNLRDENNHRKQKWIPTGIPVNKGRKKEAMKLLRTKIAEYERSGVTYYSDITVAEYFRLWLKRIRKDVRDNTYRSYKGNMENHIIPYFESKKIKLQELTTDDITKYYLHKHENAQISGRTLLHHHQNISKALNDAIAKGYIAFNPASVAKKVPIKHFEPSFLKSNQIKEVIELFDGTVIKLPVELCCIYGFRRSEVLGLTWSNIDFENGSIRIHRTLQQSTRAISGTTTYADGTKKDSSYRTMPLTKRAREILIAQKKKQKENREFLGKGYVESDSVCTFDNGEIIKPNYLSKKFHKAIINSNLPKVRLHDLRHSAASNLLEAGFSVVQVADWLGHRDSSTTLRYYAHVDKSSKMAIANALDEKQ